MFPLNAQTWFTAAIIVLWASALVAQENTAPPSKAASDTWFRTHGNMRTTDDGKRMQGEGGLRMVRDQLYGWSTDEGAWSDRQGSPGGNNTGKAVWRPKINGPRAEALTRKLETLTASNMAADRVLMRARMEEREHNKRLAQLKQIIIVATAAKNTQATQRARSLIEREEAGFAKLVERIVQRLEMAQEMSAPAGMGMGPGGMGMGPGGMGMGPGGMSKEEMMKKFGVEGMSQEEMMEKMRTRMGSTPGMPTYPQPQKNSGSGPDNNFPADAPSLGDQ